MNKLTIKYTNNDTEELNRYCLTPTGIEMRNTSSEELIKVLHGDGRRFIVYENDGSTRIIMPNEIKDILINGKSIFVKGYDICDNSSVWCDW